MTAKPTVKTLEEVNDSFTIYGVYVAGELVGKIEKHVYAERVRYAGKMYGHDTAKKAHYEVSEIRGKYHMYAFAHSTRSAAVTDLIERINQ